MMKQLLLALSLILSSSMAASAATVQQVNPDSVELTVVKPAKVKAETKKERKARQKREQQITDSIAHVKAAEAIEQGYFVLLANNLSVGRMGYVVTDINSNANFLLVQNDGGIFQVAFNNGRPGLNGMGGITQHGSVNNKQITTDKKGNVTVTYNLFGSNVNAYVSITLMAGSDRADAIVTRMMGPQRITMSGTIVPYRNDDIKIER